MKELMSINQKDHKSFQKDLEKLAITNLSGQFKYQLKSPLKDTKLVDFLKSEMININSTTVKNYIIYSPTEAPYFFYISNLYLLAFDSEGAFSLYDCNLNKISFFSQPSISYQQKTINSDYYESNPYFDNKYLKFKVTDKLYIHFKGNEKENKYNVFMKSMHPITSISFEDNKIIATFKSSFYTKIVFDYDFNIIEIDFHKTTKEKLNVKMTKKSFKTYSDILTSFSDELSLHELEHDFSYDLKLTEEVFNLHMENVKILTLNRHKYLLLKEVKNRIFNESDKYFTFPYNIEIFEHNTKEMDSIKFEDLKYYIEKNKYTKCINFLKETGHIDMIHNDFIENIIFVSKAIKDLYNS